MTEKPAPHVDKGNHSLPLSVIIDCRKVMTAMPKTFSNDIPPFEPVIGSRVFDGPNEKVPCAFFRIDRDYVHIGASEGLNNMCAAIFCTGKNVEGKSLPGNDSNCPELDPTSQWKSVSVFSKWS